MAVAISLRCSRLCFTSSNNPPDRFMHVSVPGWVAQDAKNLAAAASTYLIYNKHSTNMIAPARVLGVRRMSQLGAIRLKSALGAPKGRNQISANARRSGVAMAE
jgi:hypothetical protein